MVAIAIPPFDVVLRIFLFPVAWLLGQCRLPVSMQRLAPMCKPRRIRRSAEALQSGPCVMPDDFKIPGGNPVESARTVSWTGAGAPQPTCRMSIKGPVSMPVKQLRRPDAARFVPGFHACLRPHPGSSRARRRSGGPKFPLRAMRESRKPRAPLPAIPKRCSATAGGNGQDSQRMPWTRRAPLHRVEAIASRTRASSPCRATRATTGTSPECPQPHMIRSVPPRRRPSRRPSRLSS